MDVSGQLHATAALPPEKEHTGNHWIGGWVDNRTDMAAVAKRKKSLPLLGTEPRSSSP